MTEALVTQAFAARAAWILNNENYVPGSWKNVRDLFRRLKADRAQRVDPWDYHRKEFSRTLKTFSNRGDAPLLDYVMRNVLRNFVRWYTAAEVLLEKMRELPPSTHAFLTAAFHRASDEILKEAITAKTKASEFLPGFEKTVRVLMEQRLDVLIAETGLDDHQVQLMRAHSKGLFRMVDFMQHKQKEVEQGYQLGLSGHTTHIERAVADALQLHWWDHAYKMVGVNEKKQNHTELFLQRLTALHAPIVFLIPPNLFTDYHAGVTRDEMNYLLKNPSLMRDVYFVFGSKGLLDEDFNYRLMHFTHYTGIKGIVRLRAKMITFIFDAFSSDEPFAALPSAATRFIEWMEKNILVKITPKSLPSPGPLGVGVSA